LAFLSLPKPSSIFANAARWRSSPSPGVPP
jgi:hypothetical protein